MKGACGGGRGRMGGNSGTYTELSSVLEKALLHLSPKNTSLEGQNLEPTKLPEGEILDVKALEVQASSKENANALALQERQKVALALLNQALVHFLPGRARLRHPAFRNEHLAAKLNHLLLDRGFKKVEYKTSTGSILLTWEDETLDQAAFLAAALPLGQYLALSLYQETQA